MSDPDKTQKIETIRRSRPAGELELESLARTAFFLQQAAGSAPGSIREAIEQLLEQPIEVAA